MEQISASQNGDFFSTVLDTICDGGYNKIMKSKGGESMENAIAEAQRMQGYIVAKANQFILHSRYDLSLMEQRILACMIATIDSRPTSTRFENQLLDCELNIDTFCELCKIKKRGSVAYLKEVTKGLRDQSFWMETEDGISETFSWVEKVIIDEKKNTIMLRFSQDMKPYLLNLNSDFTSYKLPMILRFSSRYTNIIFDLIYAEYGRTKEHQHLGHLSISVDEMKARVQIKKNKENKIVNQNITFKNLRVRILEPAIKEINDFTDIMVDILYIKNGRKIETIKFVFRPKTKAELATVPAFQRIG